jgi:biopolymer transport protein ExbD
MEGTRITLRSRKKARIEIIPLIDVIFFLLATFVLFTLSLNRIQSVPVDLPFSAPPPPPGGTPPPLSKDLVTLQVSDQGNLYWNKELIDVDELPARLETFIKNTQGGADAVRVLVAGDARAKWGVTVKVLDEVRKARIEKIAMETRIRQTGR